MVMLLLGCSFLKAPAAIPNNAPVIESVSCTKDVWALAENEMICLASDQDGDPLQYVWSTGGGKIIGTGARMMWISPDTMGTYEVEIKVTDGKGGQAKQIVPVRVVTNSDGTTAEPVNLRLSLNSPEIVAENMTVKVGTATKISCIVDIKAGDKLTYEWTASGGQIKGKGIDEKTCTVVVWTAPPLTQVYSVDVVARDEKGNEAHGQVIFDVFCCPRN